MPTCMPYEEEEKEEEEEVDTCTCAGKPRKFSEFSALVQSSYKVTLFGAKKKN